VLLAAAAPPDDTILPLAIYTGLRRGELFALQRGDIDWGAGPGGGRVWGRRTLDALGAYREVSLPQDGGFIFHTAKGTPLAPDNWYKRHFLPVLERAGLRKVVLHALRQALPAARWRASVAVSPPATARDPCRARRARV
jgi:integrase